MDTRNINTAGQRYHINSYRQFGASATYFRAVPAGQFHTPSYNAFFSPSHGICVLQRIDADRGEYHTGQEFGYRSLGTYAEMEERYGSLQDVAKLAAEDEMQGKLWDFPYDDIPTKEELGA